MAETSIHPSTKGCIKCGAIKPVRDFAQEKGGRRRGACKACQKEYLAAYRVANSAGLRRGDAEYRKSRREADPDAARARDRAKYAANPASQRTSQAKWNARNRDKVAAYSLKWRIANPEARREIDRKAHEAKREHILRRLAAYRAANRELFRKHEAMRRARLRTTVVLPIVPSDIFNRDGWRCYLCGGATDPQARGTRQHNAPVLDHIMPLVRGGTHTPANVACACHRCNSRKHANPAPADALRRLHERT